MAARHVRRLAAGWLVAWAVVGCGGDDVAPRATAGATTATGELGGTVTVLAAASLTDAFGDLARAFEATHERVTVELSFAGSSALREQVLSGAPADVFASADRSTMDALVEAGAASAPVVFAGNELQVVVPAGNPGGVTGLADLADGDLLVGLCADQVPCGRLGREVLAKAGVTPAVDTEEPNVRALLSKVASGELDAGLVYRTDVLAAGAGVDGIDIPDRHNVTARYPIATLDGDGDAEAAAAFVELVVSDAGHAILADHGFRAP